MTDSELILYTVELTAMVEARLTVTVEALDPQQAIEAAKTEASNNPRHWETVDGGEVNGVTPAAYRADDDEEFTDIIAEAGAEEG